MVSWYIWICGLDYSKSNSKVRFQDLSGLSRSPLVKISQVEKQFVKVDDFAPYFSAFASSALESIRGRLQWNDWGHESFSNHSALRKGEGRSSQNKQKRNCPLWTLWFIENIIPSEEKKLFTPVKVIWKSEQNKVANLGKAVIGKLEKGRICEESTGLLSTCLKTLRREKCTTRVVSE